MVGEAGSSLAFALTFFDRSLHHMSSASVRMNMQITLVTTAAIVRPGKDLLGTTGLGVLEEFAGLVVETAVGELRPLEEVVAVRVGPINGGTGEEDEKDWAVEGAEIEAVSSDVAGRLMPPIRDVIASAIMA